MSRQSENLGRYCAKRGHKIVGALGAGKDGSVYQSERGTAIKVHEREDSYQGNRMFKP
jgi:hypothetical protein